MRSQSNIDLIVSQANQGYCNGLFYIATLIDKGKIDSVYLWLSEGKKLLETIVFPALTLAQKNLIADRLIRGRYLANQEMEQLYVQSDYVAYYVIFNN